MEEIWKEIEGTDGNYEVSSLGNVRSIAHWVNSRNGGRMCPGKVLSLVVNHNGYIQIATRLNGKSVNRLVHRLVAYAFLPKAKGKDQVNHIDGCKTNNHYTNLEWCDQYYNAHHAINTGLRKIRYGNANVFTKIPFNDILRIRELYAQGVMQKDIADVYGYSKRHISNICNNKYRVNS